jgi:hypothetical protein
MASDDQTGSENVRHSDFRIRFPLGVAPLPENLVIEPRLFT